MKLHPLGDRDHFAKLLEANLSFIRLMTEREAAGGPKNRQFAYMTMMRSALSNGCIALILEQGDEEARKHFGMTVGCALKLLGAPGVYGGGLRSYQVNIEVLDKGSRVTAIHERKPQPGEEKLSITEYHNALLCVVMFGERSQAGMVAGVPEEDYRNPGTVASPDHWMHLRALKAYLKGDEDHARREAEAAHAVGQQGSLKLESAALLALLNRDEAAFRTAIDDRLRLHRAEFRRRPNEPLGILCFPALALCRLALQRRFVLEERPYLALRFLGAGVSTSAEA